MTRTADHALLSADAEAPRVLQPFDRREAMTVTAAAAELGLSVAHTRRLVGRFDLGRRLAGGRWRVSRAALMMFANGDAAALRAYHEGRRDDPAVRAYLTAAGLG